jgi:hypothetical protein
MGNEANSQIEKISRSAGSARVSLSYSYQSNYNLSPMLLVGWGKVLSQTQTPCNLDGGIKPYPKRINHQTYDTELPLAPTRIF